LALATSIAWGLFVLSRVFRHTGKELAPYHKALGPTRFLALMAGTVGAIAIIAAVLSWLSD
jgi:hypothetical protein